jgi:peptidoglycan/xylan/chitin deacetylase (PgdA/CDA1 family)
MSMNAMTFLHNEKKTLLFAAGLFFLLLASACRNSGAHENKPVITTSIPDSSMVQPDSIPVSKPTSHTKKIYLTFDDGPNNGTPNVISIIKEEAIPASFFIIGVHTTYRGSEQKSWKALQEIPHIDICNHSYTHGLYNRFDKFYSNPGGVVKDFQRAQDSLRLKNNFVRTPGRNSWRINDIRYTDNKRSAASIDSVYKAGFAVVGWDLEWRFNHKNLKVIGTADQLISQIDYLFKNSYLRTKDHLVILMHDQAYHSQEDYLQLKEFVQKLKKRPEYEFALIRDYPGIANNSATTGSSVVSN